MKLMEFASLLLVLAILLPPICAPTAWALSPIQPRTGQLDQASLVPQSLTLTSILLKTSKKQVIVNEPLTVQGLLRREGGQILDGRNVTVTWGSNSQLLLTDAYGWFALTIMFPLEFPAGPTNITAVYEPRYGDAAVYVPAESSIQVEVSYVATMMTATVNPASIKSLELATLNGNLSAVNGPVQGRDVDVELDSASLGKATTNNLGLFTFSFSVPATVTNGTHLLTVAFRPVQEIYAPSNVTLRLDVISTTPILTATSSQLQTSNPTQQTTYTSKVSGPEVIIPAIFTKQFFLIVVAIAVVGVATTSVAFALLRRRRPISEAEEAPLRRIPIQRPQEATTVQRATALKLQEPKAIVEQVPEARSEWTPSRLLARIEDMPNEPARIQTAYQLAQEVIEQRLGETPRSSETHWEYCRRITRRAPQLEEPLTKLVGLFESIQYAPKITGTDQTVEASAVLLEILYQTQNIRTAPPRK